LLEAISGKFKSRFGFDDREHEIAGIAQQVVGAFRGPAVGLTSRHDDSTIRETLLLADLVVVPTSGV
jgi:hypothetical protein